jgi:Concanavalin A-like lectin/glucanases superfamily/Domain of unknown function (DUF2341)
MKCILTCAFAAALTAAGMQCSRTLTLAGGGTETTNGSITGKLVNENGQPSRHARVWLHAAVFNPFTDSPAQKTWADTTDSMGNYSIRLPVPIIYTLQAVQLDNRTRALVGNVEANDSVVVVATDTLRIPGTVKVLLSATTDTVNGYVYVPGTDILGFAGGKGYAILDSVPAGTVPLLSFADKNNPGQSQAIRYNVTVEPSDTTIVANTLWKYSKRVSFNTTASGANVAGNVNNFPVLIRLTNGNFDFSQAGPAGNDIRFAKQDNTPLPFEIERWDATLRSAEIWVKVDTIFGNDSSHFINMYWGNQNAASASNSAAVFDTANGFQGVWHMNESNGLTAQDATGNHYDGTPSDTAPSAGTGEIGIAQQFNGMSSSLQMKGTSGSKLNFSEDASFTVSAWVYVDTLIDSMTRMIVGKGPRQYYMKLFSSGPQKQWEFSEFVDNIGYQILAYIPAVARSWKYLVGVREGTNQYLYLDGALVNSTISTLVATGTRDTSNDVTIGRYLPYVTESNQGYAFFDGGIDEVRISSVSRSADWIKLCYMNQKEQDALLHY